MPVLSGIGIDEACPSKNRYNNIFLFEVAGIVGDNTACMTLVEIAHIYTDLVNAERDIPETEYHAKDQINALRTKYHETLMAKMKEDGIYFSDRFDATNKAFELIQNEKLRAS